MSRVSIKDAVPRLSNESETEVPVLHIFPKELPELVVGPVIDESDFTLNERLAMRQAWREIKPFERRYGQDFYFTYIMENYRTFENFRFDGKLDLRRLHGHSLNFMRFISSVIDQTDPVMFNTLLSDNHALHTRCNVSCEHMEGLLMALIEYLLGKLSDITSASLESGFQKLLEKFQAFFKPEHSNPSFMSRRSDSEVFAFTPHRN